MSAPRLWVWMVTATCAVICGLTMSGLASAAVLPDGRVYEMVTPPEGYDSEVYQPAEPGFEAQYANTQTEFPFQAAADGNRLAFVAGPTTGGSESSGYDQGNEYLAIHSSVGGWTQANISPPAAPTAVFEAFSDDLTAGFLDSLEPLVSTAAGFGEALEFRTNYDDLYQMSLPDGDYVPFVISKPPYRSKQAFATAGSTIGPQFSGTRARTARRLVFAGGSSDLRHTLFLANDALTGPAEGRPAAEGGASEGFAKENNLYEIADGQLRLVNVLPDGTTHANATLGAGGRFNHVISADGSRIFWTDLSTGHIYVRENGTRTVEVSASGEYQTASANGSTVFFTNGDLYAFEVESGHVTDLTPGAQVEKVVGSSEDGHYIYYVTTSGELELWHDGAVTPITQSVVAHGEVAADGRGMVWTSTAKGSQINVYEADTDVLYCATCGAAGTSGTTLPFTSEESVYLPRWISADGSRVFFDTREALVPQDSNGKMDAYEWERPGSGGCTESGGCLYLLSGGTSPDESYFADASESGDDVFIVTRARLVGADDNELFDVYDLRVDGYTPVTPPACTGTGCQGVPGSPPIFATPSSVTFEGVGNFDVHAKEAVKPKVAKPKAKKSKRPKHKKTKKSRSKKSARKAKRSEAKGGRS